MCGEINRIDWNDASSLGLIELINTQILHPMGLAISRNPESGHSESLLVSDDGVWEYGPDHESTILDSESLKLKLQSIVGKKKVLPEGSD